MVNHHRDAKGASPYAASQVDSRQWSLLGRCGGRISIEAGQPRVSPVSPGGQPRAARQGRVSAPGIDHSLHAYEYDNSGSIRVRPILPPLRQSFWVKTSLIRSDLAEERRRTALRGGRKARFVAIAQGVPSVCTMKSPQRPVLRTRPGGSAQ